MFRLGATPVYCINLPKRTDRAETVKKEFDSAGIRFEFVGAIGAETIIVPELCTKKHEPNYAAILACAATHRIVLNNAAEEYIMVFEDDVSFADDIKDRLRLIESLDMDFDMMYLGGHFYEEDKPAPTSIKYIHKVNGGVAGTFGYIIKTRLSEFIERNYTYNYGIDEFFARFVQPRFNCFAFMPFMVAHLDGYSDVAMHDVKYNCNKYFQKERL